MLQQLQETAEWDIVIIGGGATGLGAAVDAATRGYKTLLIEAYDFAKGLLINFGANSLEYKLIFNPKYNRNSASSPILQILIQTGYCVGFNSGFT